MSDESKGWPVEDGVLRLGDLPAERGGVIRDARLVWQAHGTLNDARDNVIVYPCSYTASHQDLAWLIGRTPCWTRAGVVIPDMFSNGLSSGAANTPDYPAVSDDGRQRPGAASSADRAAWRVRSGRVS